MVASRSLSCLWTTPLLTVDGRKGGELSGKWGPGMGCCRCPSSFSPAVPVCRDIWEGGSLGAYDGPDEFSWWETHRVTVRCQSNPSLQLKGRVTLNLSPSWEQVLIKLLLESRNIYWLSFSVSCLKPLWTGRLVLQSSPAPTLPLPRALCFRTKHFRGHCIAFYTRGNVTANTLK